MESVSILFGCMFIRMCLMLRKLLRFDGIVFLCFLILLFFYYYFIWFGYDCYFLVNRRKSRMKRRLSKLSRPWRKCRHFLLVTIWATGTSGTPCSMTSGRQRKISGKRSPKRYVIFHFSILQNQPVRARSTEENFAVCAFISIFLCKLSKIVLIFMFEN